MSISETHRATEAALARYPAYPLGTRPGDEDDSTPDSEISLREIIDDAKRLADNLRGQADHHLSAAIWHLEQAMRHTQDSHAAELHEPILPRDLPAANDADPAERAMLRAYMIRKEQLGPTIDSRLVLAVIRAVRAQWSQI